MRTFVIFGLLSLISPVVLMAQSAAWAPVEALRPGERVEVKLFSRGGRIRGAIERVTGETLVIREKRGVATVSRADVRRIRVDSGRKSKFGQVLAPSVMGGLALSVSTPQWNRSADTAFAVGSGYLLGWGLDGMINNYRHRTIYEGKRPAKN